MTLARAPFVLAVLVIVGCGASSTTPPPTTPTSPTAPRPAGRPPTDTFQTSAGPLTVLPIEHATLLLEVRKRDWYPAK